MSSLRKTYRILFLLAGVTLAASQTQAQMDERQVQLLLSNCVQCHSAPETGAPLMGDPSAWEERVGKGEEQLLLNIIQGIGGMPPMGYCSSCDEDDFRAMLQMMTGLPETK